MLSRILYKNVLLADDDEDDFLFFRDIIQQLGNPLLSRAADGEHLMKLLAGNILRPDIIFLDINMPRKNGFQCLREIREMRDFDHIPVVIMSTAQNPSIITSLYESGANLYINKPNSFDELKSAVLNALSIDYSKKKKLKRRALSVSV